MYRTALTVERTKSVDRTLGRADMVKVLEVLEALASGNAHGLLSSVLMRCLTGLLSWHHAAAMGDVTHMLCRGW